MHVAKLGPLGRIAIPGYFDIELRHVRPEVGLEQVIENLAALRLDVVSEQDRRGAAAAHGSHPVERAPGPRTVDGDGLVRGRDSAPREVACCSRRGERPETRCRAWHTRADGAVHEAPEQF